MLNRHRKETRNIFLSPMTEPSAFFCSFSPPLFQFKRELHYLLICINICAEQQTGSLIHINTGYGAVQHTVFTTSPSWVNIRNILPPCL